MVLSKFDYENTNDSVSSTGQLLRSIEEISNALHVHNISQKCLIPSSNGRSRSTEKTHLLDAKSKSKIGFSERELSHKNKKSSVWLWKPLKALFHIWHRKLTCCFFCHVHFIENLPSGFNGLSLSVHWKRKDNVMRTVPSRVSDGVVRFEDTLMNRCSVYATRTGPGNFVTYEPKYFLLFASVDGTMGLGVGKHWVDLTRLLPLTFEELKEDKSSGKWTTSFKLAGKAKGATLHVSFGFLVLRGNLVELGSYKNLPLIVNLQQNQLGPTDINASLVDGKGNGMLRQVASIPCNLIYESPNSSECSDGGNVRRALPGHGPEFSTSISFFYREDVDEHSMVDSAKFDFAVKQLEPLKPMPNTYSHTGKNFHGNEPDGVKFILNVKGVELGWAEEEQLKLEESAAESFHLSTAEVIDVDEIFKDELGASDEKIKSDVKDNRAGGCAKDALLEEPNFVSTEESEMEEELDFREMFISETVDGESSVAKRQFLEEEIVEESKLNHEADKIVKSLSLDDLAEAVVNDFFNLLEDNHAPVAFDSDSDHESPTENLWKQFEKDMMCSNNLFIGFDVLEEACEFSFAATSASCLVNPMKGIDAVYAPAVGVKHRTMNHPTTRKTKAKALEHLETCSLMQKWGLNEEAFRSSPRNRTGGFGSPIFLPSKEPIGLPPLVEAKPSIVQLKSGGLLWSLSPVMFGNAKNGGTLLMQASQSIVLPAAMGSDIMDILQFMASVGTERLSKKAHKLMPLEEVSGKLMEELAVEASWKIGPERLDSSQGGANAEPEVRVSTPASSFNNLSSRLLNDHTGSQYISINDLVPVVMDKFEFLSIEGLRIQSGMSDKEAPSIANCGASSDIHKDIEGLMDLSVSPDEWLRLDAGIFGDVNQINEHALKVLEAHNAKPCCCDKRKVARGGDGETAACKCGLLGNNLTVSLMIQLRDPLRNNEPVGAPMFALVQVERIFGHPISEINDRLSEDRSVIVDSQQEPREIMEGMDGKVKNESYGEGIPRFKMKKVHVAGLSLGSSNQEIWATKRQQESSARWMIANSMNKICKPQFSKSTAIVSLSSQVIRKSHSGNFLWSISHDDDIDAQDELGAQYPHTRNPDIIFPKEVL